MTTTTPETQTAPQPNPVAVAALYAAPTLAGVLASWQALQAGKGTTKIFLGHASQLLHVARASITYALEIDIARSRPDVPVIGRGVDDYSDRDKASLTTVTDDPDAAEMRLERFVHSTLAQYSRDEYLDCAAFYGASGWRWVSEGANCDYCAARDGNEYGLDVEFRDHPNCSCRPEAIFDLGYNVDESEIEND